jgi:tRNA 2-thiouridine synthesizing protein E
MTIDYSITFNDKTVATDKAGYLLNVDDWSLGLAQVIADIENIDMTDEHWEVIHFVREFYLEFNTSPAIRALVKAMQMKYGGNKISSRYLQRLFPEGPAKQATKVAGLPKPAKCL